MTTISTRDGKVVLSDGAASKSCCDYCPEGTIFLRWGEGDHCCGCLPVQIFDGRFGGLVNTVDVKDDLCCPTCGLLVPIPGGGGAELAILPFDRDGNWRGCPGRCCDGADCTESIEGDCEHDFLPASCCEVGCPKSCCEESDGGAVGCEKKEQFLCGGVIQDEPCEDACKGACCFIEDDKLVLHENSPMKQEECEALGGQWQGIGTTECQKCDEDEEELYRCRDPLTYCCCEHKTSKGAGLTFYQPRKKRQPQFSDTIRVRVTGTTKSSIIVHGFRIAVDQPCQCKVPFDVTFRLCWDAFNIEPYPCGSTFCDLDVTVCWRQEETDAETLEFWGCGGITVWLGNSEYDCVTTLLYEQGGHTSDATVALYGDGIIDASGTGALTLTSAMSVQPGAKTVTFTGSSTAINTFSGVIPNASGGAAVTVVKRGIGKWKLSGANTYTGGITVKLGTLVASGNAFAGASGSGFDPVIGDTAGNGVGAYLLLQAGCTISRQIVVAGLDPGMSQLVRIGAYEGTGTATFTGAIVLNRDVNLVAPSGGTAYFTGSWSDWSGSNPAVTIGADGYSGTVLIENGTLPSSTASLTVQYGKLKLAVDEVVPAGTPVTVGRVSGAATIDLFGSALSRDSLTFVGSGSLIENTLSSYGGLTLQGDVSVPEGGHDITADTTLGGAVTFDIALSAVLAISGAIGGSGGLTKDGGGTLTLSGGLSYTGTTSVQAGTLTVNLGGDVSSFAMTQSTLTIQFSAAPESGDTFTLLGGATANSYASGGLVLIGAGGATGTYDSSTSTLTID